VLKGAVSTAGEGRRGQERQERQERSRRGGEAWGNEKRALSTDIMEGQGKGLRQVLPVKDLRYDIEVEGWRAVDKDERVKELAAQAAAKEGKIRSDAAAELFFAQALVFAGAGAAVPVATAHSHFSRAVVSGHDHGADGDDDNGDSLVRGSAAL
jgi:hypothetical protein